MHTMGKVLGRKIGAWTLWIGEVDIQEVSCAVTASLLSLLQKKGEGTQTGLESWWEAVSLCIAFLMSGQELGNAAKVIATRLCTPVSPICGFWSASICAPNSAIVGCKRGVGGEFLWRALQPSARLVPGAPGNPPLDSMAQCIPTPPVTSPLLFPSPTMGERVERTFSILCMAHSPLGSSSIYPSAFLLS